MTKLLFIKLLRDMRTTWGRMVLMVLAIGLSLTVFSAMLYARSLVQTSMTSGYANTNPASARITINPGVTPDKVAAISTLAKSEPGVIDATMRSVLSLKIQKDGKDDTALQLFVAAPDDPMRIATFKIEQGSWPPSSGGILMERTALTGLKLKVGDRLNVIGFDGKPHQLTISGSVHDQSLAPAGEGGIGYIQTGALPILGTPPLLNQLAITVADQPGQTEPSHNRDTIVRTALSLSEKLKATPGVSVEQVAVPSPYEHPHQQIASTLLTALTAFGALSLLLSAILIATMFNGLLTQQIPQIGMMKAIGARSGRILQLYLIMVLLIATVATALAIIPGTSLGRALAQMLLSSALNIDVTSLSVPLSIYAITLAAGIGVPLLVALLPLLSASRRTVRAALDDRGVVDSQGGVTARFYSWLGRLRVVDRTLLMALRNVFRRRARFLLSVGLLATAGAIFVSGLNLMAGFQAIPSTISLENRWDVEARLAALSETTKITNVVQQIPSVTKVETWNSVPTSVQYAGKTNVTRTYPDQGHGSLSLSAIPPRSSVLNPPSIQEGRWLSPDDTDAIVLPQTILKTLPEVKVGGYIQLPVGERLTTWRVVGIAEELAGGACPCVSQAGFEQATGRKGQANLIRIITNSHDKDSRVGIGEAVTKALTDSGLKVQNARPIDDLLTSTEGHSGILTGLILLISFAIGIVGLIGLGSTMSTNVIERTREFGIMNAIGAPASTVRRLVVFEGIFIAAVSCFVAAIPALVLTAFMGNGLGNLFFSAPVPFKVSLQAILIWIIILTVGAVLATLAPAYRASKLTVRKALAYL